MKDLRGETPFDYKATTDDENAALGKFLEEAVYGDEIWNTTPVDRCMVVELIVAFRPDLRDALCRDQSMCPVHLVDAQGCAEEPDPECIHVFEAGGLFADRGYDT